MASAGFHNIESELTRGFDERSVGESVRGCDGSAATHPNFADKERRANDDAPPLPTEERRAAPRFKAELRASVLILAVRGSEYPERFHALKGRTRDISSSGLALTISDGEMSQLARFGLDCQMQMILPLPKGAIELSAAPARYEWLAAERRWLIGARITEMNADDRALFIDFVNECAVQQQETVAPVVADALIS